MRSMMLAYPEQRNLAAIDDEYLLGTDVLVAPVLHEGNTRAVTFSRGRWTNFWTAESFEGAMTKTVNAPLDRIPVYLRAGTTLRPFISKK